MPFFSDAPSVVFLPKTGPEETHAQLFEQALTSTVQLQHSILVYRGASEICVTHCEISFVGRAMAGHPMNLILATYSKFDGRYRGGAS